MYERRILVANLSKGRLGDDASTLRGSFLFTAMQLAAMSRADMPESNRVDFYLYVDKVGCFATEAFAGILSEARKYRLSLIVANDYLATLSESTLAAVFGKLGTLLVFQVVPTLAEQLGVHAETADQMTQVSARLLIDGQPDRPFPCRRGRPQEALKTTAVLRSSVGIRVAGMQAGYGNDFGLMPTAFQSKRFPAADSPRTGNMPNVQHVHAWNPPRVATRIGRDASGFPNSPPNRVKSAHASEGGRNSAVREDDPRNRSCRQLAQSHSQSKSIRTSATKLRNTTQPIEPKPKPVNTIAFCSLGFYLFKLHQITPNILSMSASSARILSRKQLRLPILSPVPLNEVKGQHGTSDTR